MAKFNVDLEIKPLGLKVVGTITSDGTVTPPPPPPVDPPPVDPPPSPVSNVVIAVTKPTPSQLCIGSVEFDSMVTVDGFAPTSGTLEYELRQPYGTLIREGRQSGAPWTHTWDSADYPDGLWAIRAIWITAEKSTESPWVKFTVSNTPVTPPPVPPDPGPGYTWSVSTDEALTAILIHPDVHPGDRILIAPGKYVGTRYVRLRGASGKRIIVEAEKLGTVTIDVQSSTNPNAAFYCDTTSNYCLFRNLVVTCSRSDRDSRPALAWNIIGGNHRLENCITYGCSEGVFWSGKAVGDPSNPALDAQDKPGARFCAFLHSGYKQSGTTRGHGHAAYIQGDYRDFYGCVSVGGFGNGIHVWGSGEAWSRNTSLRACVNVNNGICYNGLLTVPTAFTIGDKTMPVGGLLENMHSWLSSHNQGGGFQGNPYNNDQNNEVTTVGCYFVGGSIPWQICYEQKAKFANNMIVSDSPALPILLKPLSGKPIEFTGNRFFGSATNWRDHLTNAPMSTIPTRFPGNTVSPGRPQDSVHIYRDGESKKALVVVYNWSKRPMVDISLPWSGYRIRNAIDPLGGNIAIGGGSTVSIAMLSQTVSQPPIRVTPSSNAHLFDASGKFLHPGVEFGCFFVEVE